MDSSRSGWSYKWNCTCSLVYLWLNLSLRQLASLSHLPSIELVSYNCFRQPWKTSLLRFLFSFVQLSQIKMIHDGNYQQFNMFSKICYALKIVFFHFNESLKEEVQRTRKCLNKLPTSLVVKEIQIKTGYHFSSTKW